MAECARDRPFRPEFRPRSRSCAPRPRCAPARRPPCPSGCSWSTPSAKSPLCSNAVKRVAAWPVSTARAGIGGEERLIPHAARLAPHPCADRRETQRPAPCSSSREPTGETWRGEACDDDLILTRILTLDGLEDGVNRGPGCDSLARYIYLHGTNHETLLGRPVSHGCVRLSNDDVRELFDRVREGDLVFVAAPDASTIPDPRGRRPLSLRGPRRRRHERARPVPGDDRGTRERQRPSLRPRRARRLARPARAPRHRRAAAGRQRARLRLRGAGRLDRRRRTGAGLSPRRARNDIPIIHRSELLAHFVARHRSIAVTGTSGKSTVTAMVFAILQGRRPRPLGHHRRRSAGARGARPAGQRLCRRAPTCSWSRPTRATARSCATRRPSA